MVIECEEGKRENEDGSVFYLTIDLLQKGFYRPCKGEKTCLKRRQAWSKGSQ